MSVTPKIRAKGVERRFGVGDSAVHALGPLDFEVAEGEFLCVVGPSGCGKSTLLRILAGLINPTGGEISLERGGDGPLVATVFQDYSIYPWRTVEANIRFGLDVARVPREEARRRAAEWMEQLGLTAFAKAYPSTLSGGMRQRVSIARAMVMEPEILLMDEPFAALDAQLRSILQEELASLTELLSRTVVFITHSLEEAILLGDRVLVMSARPGVLIAEEAIPFPRPRSAAIRGDSQFGQIHNKIWSLLREEVNRGLGRK